MKTSFVSKLEKLSANKKLIIWNVGEVIGFIGFAFYLSWIWTVYYGSALLPLSLYTEDQTHIMRLVLLATVSIAFVITGRFSDFFMKPIGVVILFIGSLVLIPLNCLPVVFPLLLDTVGGVPFWIAGGVGYVLLMVQWSKFLYSLGRDRNVLLICAGMMGVGGLVVMIVGSLEVISAAIGITLIGVLSVCLAGITVLMATIGFLPRFRPLPAQEDKPRNLKEELASYPEEPHEKARVAWGSIFLAFVYSIGFGFAGYCGTIAEVQPRSVLYIGAAIIAGSVAILLIATIRKRAEFEKPLRYFLPLSACGIFPMLFLNANGRLICAAFLIGVFTAYGIINTSLLSKTGISQQLRATSIFSYGRVGNAFGMFVGWAISYWAFKTSTWGDNAITLVVVLIMAIFIITRTFVYTKDDVEVEPTSAKKEIEPQTEKSKAGFFTHKCEKVAQLYDLSPRQLEVLILLGKGRNAEYIENTLVISNHTAKAHIYNVYKKIGVHSQQDLIDLIEAVDLEEK